MSKLFTPPWLIEAKKYEGVTEIKGEKHNPIIVLFWKLSKLAGIKDDETPWCAAAMNAWLEAVGIKSPRSGAAKSYIPWGKSIPVPVYGCIAVLGRDGGGHVGIAVGINKAGNLLIYGGNQNDMVRVSAFPMSRVLGYRLPEGFHPRDFSPLPMTDASIPLSRSEA